MGSASSSLSRQSLSSSASQHSSAMSSLKSTDLNYPPSSSSTTSIQSGDPPPPLKSSPDGATKACNQSRDPPPLPLKSSPETVSIGTSTDLRDLIHSQEHYADEKRKGAAETEAGTQKKKAKEFDPEVPDIQDLHAVWLKVEDIRDRKKANINDLVEERSGWKTIRIFVSSTFKDFFQEREELVKQVFPELKLWCEKRKLHVVECDLRWGVPEHTSSETTLLTCMEEIDRCYADNKLPYFINMTSERVGWVPSPNQLPVDVLRKYELVYGLSVTEMEIVRAAYRKDNPNSIFLFRGDEFLDSLSGNQRDPYVEKDLPMANKKLKTLKDNIRTNYPACQVATYECQVQEEHQKLVPDRQVWETVLEFFKERISHQYPLCDEEENPWRKAKLEHDAFMAGRCGNVNMHEGKKWSCDGVLGREDMLKQVRSYIEGSNTPPVLVLGSAGAGKSSIMAMLAVYAQHLIQQDTRWRLFYHFVGAVPGSTDLSSLIKRLLLETDSVQNPDDLPSKQDELIFQCYSVLSNDNTKPLLLVIDALNQLDQEKSSELCSWLPSILGKNVRCIVSMIKDSTVHKHLRKKKIPPTEISVKPLNLVQRNEIIKNYFLPYNKRLSGDERIAVLDKETSWNPLWLAVACEELRVHGKFRELSQKICNIPEGLHKLLGYVLDRLRTEVDSALLVATLCLIEVSHRGMLETELLEIMADTDSLIYEEDRQEKGKKEEGTTDKFILPYEKWARIRRVLKPFLRPYGDLGEGRIDFYHRSLSKVVRDSYLKSKTKRKWWHAKLADYFENICNGTGQDTGEILTEPDYMFARKVEEYPYHLVRLKDNKRLQSFLCSWKTVDELFDAEYSAQYLQYWRHCGGPEEMEQCFRDMLDHLPDDNVQIKSHRYEQIGHILAQASRLDYAESLAKKALELVNPPPHSLYALLANIPDQRAKSFPIICKEQIPHLENCKLYQKLCIDVLENSEHKDRGTMLKLGRKLVEHALSHTMYSRVIVDKEKKKAAQTEAGTLIDKATQILEQHNHPGYLAEALMAKAEALYAIRKADEAQQIMGKASDLCLSVYGEKHPLYERVLSRFALYLEYQDKYAKAHEYLLKSYALCQEIFGQEHERTKKAGNELTDRNEEGYLVLLREDQEKEKMNCSCIHCNKEQTEERK